ncbi:hypothetical protein NBRC110019_01690 [Neptunitalea chrysea]|uniref:DUF3857 domain-containing protein n=2 Tax=Neptunitalea chrysea TaxID=1647581 RepID=A0A9W6B2V8_9FLAO|nr:hypothetical protein NBRC110019_01690 [Neptunitalea chrysea]
MLAVLGKSYAQKYKFGHVSKEELQEVSYPTDADAEAAILYNYRDSYIFTTTSTIELTTEVYKKIKIYNKEGFDWATQTVYLYKSGSSKEQISKIKAVTYNLDGTKINETKLDKDQIFKKEFSYRLDEVTFTLPNVKEGSVIEIEYKITSPFYRSFDDLNFQYEIPVKKFYAEIRTPKVYTYTRTLRGNTFVNLTTERKMDHRTGVNVDVYRYSQENIPALKDEPFVDNLDNYRGSIMFELSQVELDTRYVRYSQSWGDVAKEIGNDDDYAEDLDKARFVDDITDPLISGVSDPLQKMKNIFNYVKANYTWNGFEGKYFYNGLKKTIKEKKGNAADINLLLVAMLRYADIDANPVVICTKDEVRPLFPTLKGLNYVIAYAVINDQEYVMDATREFSEINVLPLDDYYYDGMYINNNSMRWNKISLRSPDPSLTAVNLMATLADDGSIEGKVRYAYDQHSAMIFRTNFKGSNLDDYTRDRENELSGIEISDFKVTNEKSSDKKALESFSFFSEDLVEDIGGKLYFNPLLFLTTGSSPFVSDTREYPMDFKYPFERKYNFSLNIPDGYKVEYIPQSNKMPLPDGLGEVYYLFKTNAMGIQIVYDFKLNMRLINPSYYKDIKDFFSKMVEIESEKIILSKA